MGNSQSKVIWVNYDVTHHNKPSWLPVHQIQIFDLVLPFLSNIIALWFVFCLRANQTNPSISLASSSESERGGSTPPPRKKRRLPISCLASPNQSAREAQALFAAMHQANGSSSHQNGAATSNGDCTGDTVKKDHVSLNNRDKDVVRLIGQYLRSLGLE